jgi:transcription termination/antitermination protein NusG
VSSTPIPRAIAFSPQAGIREALADVMEPAEMPQPWHVLYVKSRQEKALAADLETFGIPYYLPLLDKVTFYGSRRFRVQIPLFPGYLFMRGARDQLIVTERTRRLLRVIPVCDQKQISWELSNIQMALANGADLGPCRQLEKGWRVVVKSGPFQGLQGIVEARSPDNRLILQVGLLGQAVSMEIDKDLLEVVAPA